MNLETPVGIVVVGRNIGGLLLETLGAALKQSPCVVYVDSGSTDNSLACARACHVPTVALDASQPYSAARARNAGAEYLRREIPLLPFIQFVDGDCLLADGFLGRALAVMQADSKIAIMCGQRRERFPQASLYNQILALEWELPRGEIAYCGGDAFVRLDAFLQVDGYNARLIAGEEPELCLRLRHAGWKIWGVDADMTYHDARMTRFGQWWRRAMRAGHAYAEGAWMHGREPERHWVHETASIWFWGAALPVASLVLAKRTRGASLALLTGYPLLTARIYRRARRRGWSERNAGLYALFCALAKFPQLQGQMVFIGNLMRKRAADRGESKA